MTITIKTSDAVAFSLGQTVYFKLDSSKSGIITGLMFSHSGVEYRVEWNDMSVRWHYADGLSAEKGVPA